MNGEGACAGCECPEPDTDYDDESPTAAPTGVHPELSLTDFDDCVFFDSMTYGTIDGRAGDDVVDVEFMHGGFSKIYGGAGRDELNVHSMIGVDYQTASIDGGAGDDAIFVGYGLGGDDNKKAVNQILGGDGSDKITANYLKYTFVGGGNGDDQIHVGIAGDHNKIYGDAESLNDDYSDYFATEGDDPGHDSIRVDFNPGYGNKLYGDGGDPCENQRFRGDFNRAAPRRPSRNHLHPRGPS